jgi:hypothetical protein
MIRNMVKCSCAAPGTGTTITLAAAQPGYSSFDGFGTAAPVYYMLTDGAQSELQAGTVTVGSPSTLSRGTPLWNSAGTFTRLNFTGTCTVYNVTPAERALYFDANNALNLAGRRLYGLPATPTSNDEPARYDAVGWRALASSVSGSAVSTVIMSLPAGYARFRLEFSDTAPTAAAPLYVRWSIDGGATAISGASDYGYNITEIRAFTLNQAGGFTSYLPITGTLPAGGIGLGWIEFQASGPKQLTADAIYNNASPALNRSAGGGYCGINTLANAVIFGAVGTTLAQCRLRLLGSLT